MAVAADWLTWTATIAAAGSAIFAGLEIRLHRKEADKRAALEAIQGILGLLPAVWEIDTAQAQSDILRCYREKCALDRDATAYLNYLNALDVAALAAATGLADRRILHEYLSTIVGPSHMVSLKFLEELQDCCKDPSVYQHLRSFAAETKRIESGKG